MNTRDFRKHKKDAFHLLELFVPEESSRLPDDIRDDMTEFVAIAEREGVALAQIGVDMTLEEALSLLRGCMSLRPRRRNVTQEGGVSA